MLPKDEFIEIFVYAPLAEAEKRDPKGLYAKARAGELKNFTGINSPYEEPEAPEVRIVTTQMTAEEAAELIVETLMTRRRAPSLRTGERLAGRPPASMTWDCRSAGGGGAP